jgi:hypothetical protein
MFIQLKLTKPLPVMRVWLPAYLPVCLPACLPACLSILHSLFAADHAQESVPPFQR